MPRYRLASGILFAITFFCAYAQTRVTLTVIDETGLPVPGAQVTIQWPGGPTLQLQTDYAGRCVFTLRKNAAYAASVVKPGYFQTDSANIDPQLGNVQLVLSHEQIVRTQVNVTASPVGIDPEQTSDKSTMNTPEIVNVPYPTSRDIRSLLPFNPGVVQDASGQVHIAGSETYATLDMLDGFDIRSPVSGMLAMRVSADAVRSIDIESTRYPVEFGRSTGGVVAFYTGMGDNKFRFNATNFIPSFHDINGIRFDKYVPRITFSGPIQRDHAWFFDGLETEYDSIYIKELPSGANTNNLIRGSNLIRAQVDLTPANILSGGFLFNDYHSPYDGISALTPQQSTTKRDTVAWLPYVRDQHSFHGGALLETGFGVVRFRDGYEPRGTLPYDLTPELSHGSYFESAVSHSRREEANAVLYLPPRSWFGRHDLKTGIDLDHIAFTGNYNRAPVNYLREDGTLLRQSTFPALPPFTRHNVEAGAYVQDRWLMHSGLLFEPGVRFDWDEVLRRPEFSPRFALVYSPSGTEAKTKISAGAGLYYEHTQLEYLQRALAGIRYDTYYAADGTTPVGGPLLTSFAARPSALHQTRALNWSLGIEQKLPWQIYGGVNFLQKRIVNGWVYQNQSAPGALSGTYLLTDARRDHYNAFEIEARKNFANGYTLFGSYTRSSARTNAAVDYVPSVSLLGPQQHGPLAWDAPDRVVSWGWLPFPLPWFRHNWDFVYTMQWQTGFPYTSINANRQVIGAPGSRRFPDYVNFSPGLEWRFHFHGAYFGLRGVLENATGSQNPAIVNNVVDSPAYGTFSQPMGRALTGRIRLISEK
ncbi:MAG TPA: hypothetical protein VFA02_07050 [Pseudacidobacterium sp.]|nr:hypothetical protein [Pseudacidobacterium sp.]